MNLTKIPVLLLTGYLGSGKTTLLNRILGNKRGIRFAVIVNDIGEVNIDADLIEKGGIVDKKDESLVALQNGCICCTLKMDLVEQLRDITSQHRFDYIVIEASGICEPEPIAQTICSIPTMGPEYIRDGIPVVDSIVTVVDALRMKDEFGSGKDLLRPGLAEDDIENLVIQQIEFCNIILLNKASEVEPAELGRIREIIHAIQPKAEIINCDYCDIDFDRILNTNAFDFDKVATSAAWINEIEGHHDDDDEEEDEDEHHHHHDHEEHHHEEHHEHHHDHHHHHDDEGEAEELLPLRTSRKTGLSARHRPVVRHDARRRTSRVYAPQPRPAARLGRHLRRPHAEARIHRSTSRPQSHHRRPRRMPGSHSLILTQQTLL